MRAFVIRGFGVKKDSKDSPVDFDRVETELIRPAMIQCGLVGGTTAEFKDAGSIHADMFAEILAAEVVICDITIHNANVFYELGVRHALRKKHTVLIKGDPSADTTPFDIAGGRYLKYPVADPGKTVAELVDAIKAGLNGVRETDSPIFQILPTLSQANPEEVRVVPMDFIEEVQRAKAAGDKGWLRLLADEVRGQRFEYDGLPAIGAAQWSIKDYAGARQTWEAVRAAQPNDVKANLALNNIYERLYRDEKRPVLLEYSTQAIDRVLKIESLKAGERAEALALQGRNLKTLWRLDFERLETLEQRRAAALDIRLKQSYEAYRDAFYFDLNHFYPGLAALQMGVILRELSSSPAWPNLFELDSDAAEQYRKDLLRQLAELEIVVATSISAALRRKLSKDDATWAGISKIDLKFITLAEAVLERDAAVFVPMYKGAIPAGDRFAKDAVRGQLELFASLGIREKAAAAAIASLQTEKPKQRKLHLLVVTGHMIDAPGAPAPRFPASAEQVATTLLAERILSLQKEGEEMVVLASAAPGTDILAHEWCAKAVPKQESMLCLPMPAEVVASEVFERFPDEWRNRFFKVVAAADGKTLVLHEGSTLPRWLLAKNDVDPWERGNRWVLKLAESWGADRVTLLALWDQKADATLGGTAQMVRLARETGRIAIETIDTKALLNIA